MKLYKFTLFLVLSVMTSLAYPVNFRDFSASKDGISSESNGIITLTNDAVYRLRGEVNTPDGKPYTFYPNPARGNILHIDYEATNNSVLSIRVLNMLGVAMLDKKFDVSRGMNSITLDISRVLKGLYLLEIVDSPYRYVEKFIVENE